MTQITPKNKVVEDSLSRPVVVIGTFDGVHRGHQSLFAKAKEIAKLNQVKTLVLTFDPHPKELLLPRFPPRLCSQDEKVRRIHKCLVDQVKTLRFDKDLASTSARDFVEEILVKELHPTAVVVGFNFSFGKGGKADPQDLRDLLKDHDLSLIHI